MHAKNMQMIADLRKAGIDTTELEKVLNATPGIDNYVGQGLTRTQEFTTIVGEKRRLETQFAEVQNQLAAMQNQIKGGGLNAATVTAIQTRMNSLKQFLISEEYPESQVNDLFKDIEGNIAASLSSNSPSTPATTPAIPAQNQQTKGVTMTDAEIDKIRNEAAAVSAAFSTDMGFVIQSAIAEFNQLYKRFPSTTEMASLRQAVNSRHVQGGENLDSVIDETFKFSTQRAENATAELNTKLAEAKQQGRAEAFQEAGVIPGGSPKGGRISRAPVFSRNISRTNTGDTPPPPLTNNNPPPNAPIVNSPDTNTALKDSSGLLPFQQRGNKQTRMNHLATVAAENPDLFQNDGYQPRYGREPQQ